MKNRYEINLYSFYDISGMQEHLEKMARKGWFLDKITNAFWCYHRDKPKQLHYSISYYAKASAFESEPSDGQQTFQEFCEYAGWKLVAFNATLQVFANEKDNPVPIHTEPQYEIDEIKHLAKRYFISDICVIVIAAVNCYFSYNMWKSDPISLFTSPFFPGISIALTMMAIYLGTDLLFYLNWIKKAQIAAQNNEFLNTHHKLHSTFGLVSWLSLVILLVLTILSFSSSTITYAVYFIGMLFIGFTINKFLEHFKRRKYSTNKNRALIITITIVLCLVLTTITSSSFFLNLGHYNNSQLGKDVLQISDFKDIDNTEYIHDLREESSIFLSQQTFTQHAVEYLDYSLNYTVIDVKMNSIQPMVINQLLHAYDEYGNYESDYDPNHPFYVYKSIEAKSWGVSKAYQLTRYNENDDNYILIKGNRIVQLSSSWPLTYEDKAVIINKLFN